ncbi:hypothetical protein B0H11DRAFT_765301 [Mycena galericulata]|nr:hypothetical protein B0H11DRAFT_765301 [Mycena galericulata]
MDFIIQVSCSGRKVPLKLRGVIYHGSEHFTSRIITPGGGIWFHDGMTTGSTTVAHGNMRDVLDKLHLCEGRRAATAVYAVC